VNVASLNPFKRSARGRTPEPATLTPSVDSEIATIESQIARKRLQQQLLAARERQKLPHVKFHHQKLTAIADELKTVLRAAAKLNSEAAHAWENARRSLGDQVAQRYLNPVIFNGMIREDLVESWCQDISSYLRSGDRKLDDVTAQQPEPQIAVVGVQMMPKSAPKPLPTPATAPTKVTWQAAALPDEDGPLEEGCQRVYVIRAGLQDRLGRQSQIGRRIQLPAKDARAAVMSGAADFVDETPAAVGAEQPNEGAAK
jgi:hypothetical protein